MGFKAPENLRPTQRDHPRPENRRRRASGGDVGPKVVRFSTQVRRGFLQRGVSPRIGGDRPPVTLAPGEAHPFPRKLDASGDKRYPARRWVVERTLAWLSKCRAVLVRYDKKAANYLGVLQLACALLWFRRQWRLAILR